MCPSSITGTRSGVTAVGHRRKLLDAIAALRKADVAPAIRAPANDRSQLAADATPFTVPEGERRQVTADLTGYAALTRVLGDEAVHSLMGRFFEMADGAIESFGGTIDKHIGDCVMAVFGAPVAHSNDSERAIRAALAIRERMPALSEAARPVAPGARRIASGQGLRRAGPGLAPARHPTVAAAAPGRCNPPAPRRTDADRLDLLRSELLDHHLDIGILERHDHAIVDQDPLVDFEAEMPRRQGLRLFDLARIPRMS
jgi:hypothetical protein